MDILKGADALSAMLIMTVITVDIFIASSIAAGNSIDIARAYFLSVAQGDAELVAFPGNVKVMFDAGSDAGVVGQLGKLISPDDAYIDIAVLSEPIAENFIGYDAVLDHYRIGVFIYNGRDGAQQTQLWFALLAKIKAKKIPIITVAKGDTLHYGKNEIDILAPDHAFAKSPDSEDAGLVQLIKTEYWRSLFTARIGSNVENYLLIEQERSSFSSLSADILKVSNHGSKHSSESGFLKAVGPKIAVIESAPRGPGGQPSNEVLARIASSTRATAVQTGKDGTVEIGYDTSKGKLIIVRRAN